MGQKLSWDQVEEEWVKASNYPVRKKTQTPNVVGISKNKPDDSAELRDTDFGTGLYIPSPKTFKEAG